ncbi:sensor histidine kinase [Butyrivibrio sp. MC2013]|uniref:sensor histidine kinase n=1 Tax=Butyrivibrio sp. MC2013 TaxID=1280686 RepID=UPI0018CA68F0|nr:HAMP domain-containing sensor histidine kinase [Butyrivibrio sp. MC2013]
MKIIAMRLSLKEMKEDYEERSRIHTNTLLTVSSRDRRIRQLASSMNNTLEKLQSAYNRYENGDQEIKKAITNISHDLRTPLTAISGYLELAQRLDKSPELEKYLSVIQGRTDHMKKLTEELFEYSLMTGGEITEDRQEVNINRMLEDCLMNYYPSLKARGISPDIDITEKKIVRYLYPTYVERILNNLMSNALKYSDGDLEIKLSDEGVLSFSNSTDKLSNVDVNKLFDRFFTVETGSRESTGLGLSIVKLFADRMDLRLNATYENGKITIVLDF